jgi:hypothetical protein
VQAVGGLLGGPPIEGGRGVTWHIEGQLSLSPVGLDQALEADPDEPDSNPL